MEGLTIDSCQSAWDASVAAAEKERLSANHDDFHSLAWLVEMNFELGHRKAADAALEVFASAVRHGLGRQQRAAYATEVASYVARTGESSRIEALLAPLEAAVKEDGEPATHHRRPPPAAPTTRTATCAPAKPGSAPDLLEQLAVVDARARAAAMQHDLHATKGYVAEMEKVQGLLRPIMAAMQPKEAVARIDEAHARHLRALAALASSDDRALLNVLRESAADADQGIRAARAPISTAIRWSTRKSRTRCCALAQPGEAAAEYEGIALQTHLPGRSHSLLGLARTQKGDPRRASYQQLVALWGTADVGTPGLDEARSAVGPAK